MSPRAESYDGCAAALPMAAAFTLLASLWLPIRFEYHPNDLGIVSVATETRYPVQQETFWLVFGVALGSVAVWLLARALRRSRLPVGSIVAMEALGAGALLATLWLPSPFAAVGLAVAVAGARWISARGGSQDLAGPAEGPIEPKASGRSPLSTALWVAVAAALALLLAPGLWINLWNAVNHVPDERLTFDTFKFHSEVGQHLTWASTVLRGGFQGRDFFCLYGPLNGLAVVGFWGLAGRSIAAWYLYWSLTRVAAWIGLLLLGGALVRRRPWALAIPFLLPWIQFRLGLALFGLLFLHLWLRGGGLRWCVAAGFTSGISLLYSQEFGAALLAAAAAVFAVRREARPAIAFGASLAAAMAPVLAWFAANNALGPMLHDLVQYPRWMMAGYAKLPFPSIAQNLPLGFSAVGSSESLELRLGYAVPAVCVAALLLALRVADLDLRHPVASIRAVAEDLARDPARLAVILIAVFGLVSFRSALGRSSLPHAITVLPAAALLLCIGLDRTAELWRRGAGLRPLAAWRLAAIVVFALHGGLLEAGSPVSLVRESVGYISTLLRHGNHPTGNQRVLRVARWVQLHTDPSEPVLFLPNNAAYYYLTDRPNPIRFAISHQIVTDEHRAEVLSDLRENPPRFIVWDPDALRVDDIPDSLVFGPEILGWIEENYERDTLLGTVEVLRRRESASRR